MTTITPPICITCKHITRDREGDILMSAEGDFTCRAYPDGIPTAIILSEVDHTKPYKGDHGIQYEQDTPQQPR